MQNDRESVLTFILTVLEYICRLFFCYLCSAALDTLILPTSDDLTQFC